MMQAEADVTPFLHAPLAVQSAIVSGDIGSRVLKETIAGLASESMWRQLWLVADSLSREVSVLFDRDGRIWVDIGTAGQVRLSPPNGATIPFSLWIHTHPWDAYWSPTDLSALASYSRILDRALVLGHDHMKSTRKAEGDYDRLGAGGPLSVWTSEEVRAYEEEGV
jgi:hypothetical protein